MRVSRVEAHGGTGDPGPVVAADEHGLRRRAPAAPAAASSPSSGAPYGTSKTPGVDTAPPTVARKVPGSSGVPTDRNQSGAEPGEQRQVGERLDVVHQGRAAVARRARRPGRAGPRGRPAGR